MVSRSQGIRFSSVGISLGLVSQNRLVRLVESLGVSISDSGFRIAEFKW